MDVFGWRWNNPILDVWLGFEYSPIKVLQGEIVFESC